MSFFSRFRQCTVLVDLIDITIVPKELNYYPSTADRAYGRKFCFYTHFFSFVKNIVCTNIKTSFCICYNFLYFSILVYGRNQIKNVIFAHKKTGLYRNSGRE